MKVQLKFLATYRKYLPNETSGYINEIELTPGTCIFDLLNTMNIPVNNECVILINGKTPQQNQKILNGDEICIFPAMAGG